MQTSFDLERERTHSWIRRGGGGQQRAEERQPADLIHAAGGKGDPPPASFARPLVGPPPTGLPHLTPPTTAVFNYAEVGGSETGQVATEDHPPVPTGAPGSFQAGPPAAGESETGQAAPENYPPVPTGAPGGLRAGPPTATREAASGEPDREQDDDDYDQEEAAASYAENWTLGSFYGTGEEGGYVEEAEIYGR